MAWWASRATKGVYYWKEIKHDHVRERRMMLDSSFDNISDKQIFDKIRGFWRYPRTKLAHEPPNAEESLNCKFQCLESNENMPNNESAKSEYESDTSEISGSCETSYFKFYRQKFTFQ